jgi:hypothetical protein
MNSSGLKQAMETTPSEDASEEASQTNTIRLRDASCNPESLWIPSQHSWRSVNVVAYGICKSIRLL